MAYETSTAEMIGNIIGGFIFYGLLILLIYYVVRIAMRHERERQKLKENDINGKHKR